MSTSQSVPTCRLGTALRTQAWTELLDRGTVRRYRPGAVILRQGSRGSYVLALAEGRAMITRTEASGQELIVAIMHPGEVLGEMTVLDQAPRTATVTALAPCTVHVMSSEQFRALIRSHDAADSVAPGTLCPRPRSRAPPRSREPGIP
jgi:CRP/FNR family transcriptional regulator, cyclic AMP receptor protein